MVVMISDMVVMISPSPQAPPQSLCCCHACSAASNPQGPFTASNPQSPLRGILHRGFHRDPLQQAVHSHQSTGALCRGFHSKPSTATHPQGPFAGAFTGAFTATHPQGPFAASSLNRMRSPTASPQAQQSPGCALPNTPQPSPASPLALPLGPHSHACTGITEAALLSAAQRVQCSQAQPGFLADASHLARSTARCGRCGGHRQREVVWAPICCPALLRPGRSPGLLCFARNPKLMGLHTSPRLLCSLVRPWLRGVGLAADLRARSMLRPGPLALQLLLPALLLRARLHDQRSPPRGWCKRLWKRRHIAAATRGSSPGRRGCRLRRS